MFQIKARSLPALPLLIRKSRGIRHPIRIVQSGVINRVLRESLPRERESGLSNFNLTEMDARATNYFPAARRGEGKAWRERGEGKGIT
jgi:hypothetical protein